MVKLKSFWQMSNIPIHRTVKKLRFRPPLSQTLGIMNSVTKHYDTLFAKVVSTFGALRSEIMSAIIGFGVGGPVSVAVVDGKPVYVTCELSLYPEQLPSVEGERFELLMESPLNQSEIQDLLSALGRLSFNTQLGDGHTIDVSGISPPNGPKLVSLQHFSSVSTPTGQFGIYQVISV